MNRLVPPAAPPDQPLSLGRCFALIAAWIVVSLIGFLALFPALGVDAEHLAAAPARALAALACTFVVGVFGVVGYGSIRGAKRSARAAGWRLDHLGRDVALGLGGAVVSLLVLFVFLRAMGTTGAQLGASLRAPGAAERGLYLVIGVQAALVEETLFRGNLLTALAQRIGPRRALVAQAVIFALYHLKFALPSLGMKTALGLCFGGLALRTRGLVAPAVAHAAFWIVAGTL